MHLWRFAVFFDAVDGNALDLAVYIDHCRYSTNKVFGMGILYFATKSKDESENVHMSTHTQKYMLLFTFHDVYYTKFS